MNISSVREELIQMAEEDQKMRFESQAGKRQFDKNIDIKNYKRLKKIIEELKGWPTISRVGEEASYAAWLIAQHADYDREFQKYCLQLMLKVPDDVLKSNIAYLTDRVAVGQNKPQIYGTQFFENEKGELAPRPIKDINKLDDRRESMDLEPFAIYDQKMRGEYQWSKNYENPKVGRFIKSP